MKTTRFVLAAALLSLLTILSAAVIIAQESTEEPAAESTSVASSFNDNRINGEVFLGGLAVYCEDENGNTDGNTFQNGGITVWGADGQKYIELTAAQLRGDEEIMQPPPTLEAGATEEPMMEMTLDPSATEEPMDPILLAQADTVNGTIYFFRIGTDRFTLQGNDNTGKFFSYTWIGCALGALDIGAGPIISMGDMPMVEVTEMATMEATAEATASS